MANISAIKLPDNSNYDLRASAIPFGIVDSSSTSTAFTVTVPGITALEDGVICMLKNGKVTSASGFTINVNGLGAKPVYSNMAAATADTTIFNVNYTMIFVYDETRVEGGCWICYRGFNSNDNTIGYQIRTGSLSLPVSGATGRYRILFTSPDGTHFVPSTLNTSTNATAKRDVNTAKIDPFGRIVYYSSTTILSAEERPGASSLWQQYTFALGYSFNRTGAALTMTLWKPVFVKCAPQSDGSAIIDADTPFVQELPSTEDGKIYIWLGIAYSATNIELTLEHPVYEYKNGGIRQYTNATASSGGGGSGVSDVQIDGTSIVSGGVASIPYANEDGYGVVKIEEDSGLAVTWTDVDSNELTYHLPYLDQNFKISSLDLPIATSSTFGAVKFNDGNASTTNGYVSITGSGGTARCVPLLNGEYVMNSSNLPLATTSASGAMSASDKTKLDSISMSNGIIDSSVLPSFVNVVTIGSGLDNDYYQIDKTYSEISSALSSGHHVIVKEGSSNVYPYVGYVSINNVVSIAFGTSATMNSVSVIDGYLILQNNIALRVSQYTSIPTTASEVGAVPTSRTVNGKALSSNVTLSASDVSAIPSSSIASTDSTTHSDFANKGTAKAYVPDMRFIAFWNGGYDSTGASNLSRCASGAIIGSNTINNYANQLAKAETVYTGAITWNSSITTQTTNVLKRKGNMVQCEIRFSAPATRVSNQAIGTIPTGYRPLQRMYVNGVRAWAVQATAPILINTDGEIKFMNEAFAASASYVIAVTWITDDNYPS